jgi:alkanesulfonate monooxygenase SsuD/methylene tetrahydromethanopterin reductase-like flavin-dependent oxidoreductase (luciferase family)
MADAFAALSELTGGREISLGIGTGTRSIAGEQVDMVKPVTMVEEILKCLRCLFSGEEIKREEFPNLADYFHLKARSFRLRFRAASPIRLYYGGFGAPGPRLTQVVGCYSDGALRGTRLTRSVDENLGIFRGFERARVEAGIHEPLRKAMIINASLSADRLAARNHAKRFASHVLCDERDDVLERIGVDLKSIEPLRRAYANNQGVGVGASLVPDAAIDKVVIAGTPADCLDRIAALFEIAEKNDFLQVLIGVPLGPDVEEAINLWAKHIVPAVKASV